MSDLRPAALICKERRSDQLPRIMIFEDHNDAYDTMMAMDMDKYKDVWMCHFEHYGAGQKPKDLPDKQEKLFK